MNKSKFVLVKLNLNLLCLVNLSEFSQQIVEIVEIFLDHGTISTMFFFNGLIVIVQTTLILFHRLHLIESVSSLVKEAKFCCKLRHSSINLILY